VGGAENAVAASASNSTSKSSTKKKGSRSIAGAMQKTKAAKP